MKIAYVGLKGVPAKWGGIEKYVEEIGARLAERGHHVTVFCSNWFVDDHPGDTYRGMHLVRLPVLHSQGTDALSNALLASLKIIFANYDIVHFHTYASYYFVPIIKLFGKITVITSHGLVDDSWNNPKYTPFALRVIRRAGKLGINSADRVTTIADIWRKRINELYKRDSDVLPSGIDRVTTRNPDIIMNKYGLQKDRYLLFLGRIDPIKRIDWLLRFQPTDQTKTVIAGGSQDAATERYYSELKAISSPHTVFTGPVRGAKKEELLSNCKAFVNPSSSEGMPITVLEAMAYGRCCLASDIPAHREVIQDGETGFLFESSNESALHSLIETVMNLPADHVQSVGARARKEVGRIFDWDKTALLTEKIYLEMLNGKQQNL